ncbi:4029_t:CDS:2, partial [Scutellospora calospora]
KAKNKIELYPLVAISTCYQQVFETKTEYSSLTLNEVVSSVGNPYKDRFYGINTRFISLFIARYHREQHLFVLKIEEYQCVLEIYL